MKDQTKISNAYYELKQAAKTLDVPVWVVVYAKEHLGTNDRDTVYEFIKNNAIRIA